MFANELDLSGEMTARAGANLSKTWYNAAHE
jgi:hypothetical protein